MQRRRGLDQLDLINGVEIFTFVQQHFDVTQHFKSSTNFRFSFAHTLGNGSYLAMVLRHNHNDAVCLAKFVGSQHHTLVAILIHESTPPNRRSLR